MAKSNSTAIPKALLPLMAVTMSLLLATCTDIGSVYSKYQPISDGGWLRDDTLRIVIGPLRHSGLYTEEFGLRTDSRYPFMQLVVIVTQQGRPSGFLRTDTLCMRLTDDDGYFTGEGISHYQYRFPLPSATFVNGDTLTVSIRHNMMRSPLTGITDVGLTIRRE